MSVQSEVHDFLATIAKGANGDYVPLDPGKLAEQIGVNRNKVNKTLHNLTQQGKIELERTGTNNRFIKGFKLLAGPAEKPRAAAKVGRQRLSQPVTIKPDAQQRRRRSIPTPHLDEYEAAKSKFERLTSELGELVQAEFKANEYAEEGLALRERLHQLEDNYGPLWEENESLKRDLRALRGRVERELAEGVARSERANGAS